MYGPLGKWQYDMPKKREEILRLLNNIRAHNILRLDNVSGQGKGRDYIRFDFVIKEGAWDRLEEFFQATALADIKAVKTS